MALTCLDTIIGLAPTECPCDGTPPAGFDTSDSGHYLTDVEYGFPVRFAIDALRNCSEADIWEALSNARTEAIRDFEIDISNELKVHRENTFKAWRGVIGETSSKRTDSTNKTYAGVQIRPNDRSIDKSFVIKAIWAGFTTSSTFDVTISSNAIGFTPVVQSVTTIANRFNRTVLNTPVVIDLYNNAQPGLTYALTYNTAGLTALGNRKHCGCGKLPGWTNTMRVDGFASDDLLSQTGDHYDRRFCSTRMWGIALEGYFACDDTAFLCNLDELGRANLKSLLGRAISYKAALKLMLKADKSEKINQFTLLHGEERAARIHMYSEAYTEILQFIARNSPTGSSSCWGCNRGGMRVQSRLI